MNEQTKVHPLIVFRAQVDERSDEFRKALPTHISVDRFKRVLVTAVQTNPDLIDCDRRSFWNAAMTCSQKGLMPDGREAAITTRKGKNGVKMAVFIPMVAGIRKLARNSGEIATWDVHAVYENDEFTFELGDNPMITHRPPLSERGKLRGVYSVCTLKTGEKSRDVMGLDEVYKIRDKADAWKAYKAGFIKDTPWFSAEGEMAKKTVAKRHSKVLPMSTDLEEFMKHDDELFAPAIEHEMERVPQAPEPVGGIAGRLDAIASDRPKRAYNKRKGTETVDADTGEVTQPQSGQQYNNQLSSDAFPGGADTASDDWDNQDSVVYNDDQPGDKI
jgi:recombination protein RecT